MEMQGEYLLACSGASVCSWQGRYLLGLILPGVSLVARGLAQTACRDAAGLAAHHALSVVGAFRLIAAVVGAEVADPDVLRLGDQFRAATRAVKLIAGVASFNNNLHDVTFSLVLARYVGIVAKNNFDYKQIFLTQ